jgi:Flp pilus assembly protein TadG
MERDQPTERGQIMVLLVLVFVALLGFAGLSIDVGMLYSDRRSAQNAADAAATEGALGLAQDLPAATIKENALAKAAQNGFDNNGTTNWVEVVYPYNGDSQLVQVKIKANTNTSLIHLFNPGVSQNQVESVVQVQPKGPALAGYSLYVLDDDCSDSGIQFKGGGNADPSIDIQQGGAFSRSCLNGNNNSHNFIRADGPINCLEQPGQSYPCGTIGGFSPEAEIVSSDPLADFKIAIPDCMDRTIAPARTASGDTLEPGYYTNVGSATQLKPGLYCINGTEFSKTLSTISGNGYDEGVTIVFMTSGASFSYTGQTKWNIKAAKPGGSNAPNLVPGAVILSDVEYSMSFGGNAEASFWGTVYSPKAHFDMGGTADGETVSSQIIIHDYNSHGTTTLRMKYDGSWFYPKAAQLSVYR